VSCQLVCFGLVPNKEHQLRRYRWREVSIVFQGAMNALNPVRRIGEQIAEPIEIRLREPKEAALARATALLELVGIPGKRANAYPHELSGGMRQRAMIAMALACDPAAASARWSGGPAPATRPWSSAKSPRRHSTSWSRPRSWSCWSASAASSAC